MLKKFKECGCVNPEEVVIDCDKCDDSGWIEETVDENQIVFVNIYEITREYGGPEEGGWWYNNFECVESVPVKNKNSELMKEEMEKEHASRKHGNIYSVLGGTDVNVIIEEKPKQSETKERPRYE